MKGREEVVKYFELCLVEYECSTNCPYWDNNGSALKCTKELAKDVLTLLKGQEPVAPIRDANYVGMFRCGICRKYVGFSDSYCSNCGRKVRWE